MSLICIEICISIAKWYGPLFYVFRWDFREISIGCIYISVQGVTVARSEMSTLWQVTSGEHNSDNMSAAFEFVIPYATTRVSYMSRIHVEVISVTLTAMQLQNTALYLSFNLAERKRNSRKIFPKYSLLILFHKFRVGITNSCFLSLIYDFSHFINFDM